ncbi:hypothetical protein FA95DRAFT_1504178 [Auriscalpium vulgare]|uniref:Uncharacterized protein n=1 Tax=Auriscalpium vulgare TaxID=40419 RepID=A0ACB8R776_9AGAM|nr:hypothetical protein FA95DRAFT_1504178 [Auriscalpium vulgare]
MACEWFPSVVPYSESGESNKLVTLRTSESIFDRNDRMLVQLAGRPAKDASWPGEAQDVSELFDDVGSKCDFNIGQLQPHTRGQYPVMRAGFSFGGGPKEPYNVKTATVTQGKLRQRLLRHPGLCRFAGFQSSVLSLHRKALFLHVDDVVAGAMAQDGSLEKAFEDSVFPTATFNFGPRALTRPHRDYKNIPYGWCAVTAFGRFDHTKGGHLVIWELKLVIEFPPGSTILLPSAILTHSNTPIQAGETRQSFTQYCAGDLVRWQSYGYRTEERLCAEDPELRQRLEKELPGRWRRAVDLFSTKRTKMEGEA